MWENTYISWYVMHNSIGIIVCSVQALHTSCVYFLHSWRTYIGIKTPKNISLQTYFIHKLQELFLFNFQNQWQVHVFIVSYSLYLLLTVPSTPCVISVLFAASTCLIFSGDGLTRSLVLTVSKELWLWFSCNLSVNIFLLHLQSVVKASYLSWNMITKKTNRTLS